MWCYSVPNLQFYLLSARLDKFGSELHSDGGVVIELELFLQELEEDARLPDACLRYAHVLVSPITMYLNKYEYELISIKTL